MLVLCVFSFIWWGKIATSAKLPVNVKLIGFFASGLILCLVGASIII